MTDWYPELYMGARARKRKRKLMAQVERGRFYPGLYLITEAAGEADQLDIISSRCLLLERAHDLLPPVVGMALGYEEVLEVLVDIARETYGKTGTGNLLAYVRQKAGR